MRCAVISDVHSNMEALAAVLGDVIKRKILDIHFLGDAVGYGPNPNECVEMLKEHCKVLLAGTHDWGVLGLTDIEYFNEYARDAILWTMKELKEDNLKTLGTFPIIKPMTKENIIFVHSTPKEPEQWHYLLTQWDAEINFHYFEQQTCVLGHSHQPFVIEKFPTGEMVTHRREARIGKIERYIINAGSVGQPRDRDPRACYAILEDEKVELVRVPYPVEKTQKKMREAGLPRFLVERLSEGT
jgi:diadenosine tetraphosphatase ApaH/serine/threonine PP2A family protein phosphatase